MIKLTKVEFRDWKDDKDWVCADLGVVNDQNQHDLGRMWQMLGEQHDVYESKFNEIVSEYETDHFISERK